MKQGCGLTMQCDRCFVLNVISAEGFDAGSQLTVSRLTGCETDTVSPQCTLAVLADCVVPGPGKGREGRDSGSSSGAAGYGRTTLLYITRHCSTIHYYTIQYNTHYTTLH